MIVCTSHSSTLFHTCENVGCMKHLPNAVVALRRWLMTFAVSPVAAHRLGIRHACCTTFCTSALNPICLCRAKDVAIEQAVM